MNTARRTTRLSMWWRTHARTIIVIKILILVGLLSVYFLPPLHAAIVNIVTNAVWLFKT